MAEDWTVWTPKKRGLFLKSLSRGSSVSKAAAAAKVARQTAYNLRKSDEEFAAEWEAAIEQGTDVLEDEAYRRAAKGTLKPVYQKGVQVGAVREFSDTLMIVLLKARRPEKYKERAEVKNTGVPTLNLILNGNIPAPEANHSSSDKRD